MYQVYVEGGVNDEGALVGVAYKKGGSGPIARKSVKLSTIGMKMVKSVNRLSLGASEVGIKNVTKNGLEMTVDYENKCVYIVPLSNGGKIGKKRVKYSFGDLGIKYEPQTDIQKAKNKSTFRI